MSSNSKKRKSTHQPKNGSAKIEHYDDDPTRMPSSSSLPKTIKVRFIREPNEVMKPIICSFPGGLPESLQQEHDDSNNNNNITSQQDRSIPKFVVAEADPIIIHHSASAKGKKTTIIERTLIGKDDTCLYTGSIRVQRSEKKTPSKNSSTDDNDTTRNQFLATEQRSRICIGILDKETNHMSINESFASGNVFSLNQSVPSYNADSSTSVNNNTAVMTAVDRYNALFRDFGSSKKNKVIKSQRANEVNIEAVVGAGNILSNTFIQQCSETNESSQRMIQEQLALADGNHTTNSVSSGRVDEATEHFRKNFLPPFDMKTKQPRMIYNFQQVIGPSVWNYISRIVEKCVSNSSEQHPIDILQHDSRPTREKPKIKKEHGGTTENQPPTPTGDYWNESIVLLLAKIKRNNPELPFSSFVKDQIKYCIVLNHFINLNVLIYSRTKFKPVRGPDDNKDSYMGTPVDVAERFLQLFATSVIGNNDKHSSQLSYAMSNVNLDCCYIHLLLLYIFTDHGCSGASTGPMRSENIRIVADDLKVDPVKAVSLLKQAGCVSKMTRKKPVTIVATLSAPLKFPATKRMYGGGKKR